MSLEHSEAEKVRPKTRTTSICRVWQGQAAALHMLTERVPRGLRRPDGQKSSCSLPENVKDRSTAIRAPTLSSDKHQATELQPRVSSVLGSSLRQLFILSYPRAAYVRRPMASTPALQLVKVLVAQVLARNNAIRHAYEIQLQEVIASPKGSTLVLADRCCMVLSCYFSWQQLQQNLETHTGAPL